MRPSSFPTGLLVLALTAGACAAGPAATPRPPDGAAPARTARAELGPAQRERLQRLTVPLLKAMNNPTPLDKVRVGVIDDAGINAANAGNGQFYVTRDLGHVAKVQLLGAGLSAGIAILDQIFPGSGAITSVAGELVVRGYTRREEYAADRHSVELLKRVGRSKDVMIQSLDWLVATSGASGGGLLATHPSTEDRLKELPAM